MSSIKTEVKITYADSKIDEFVIELEKILASAKNIYKSGLIRMKATTIGDLIENPTDTVRLSTKLENAVKELNKLYSKYFNVTDNYDYGTAPKNVDKLESLNEELYDVTNKIEDIHDFLNDILENVESKFKKR